MKLSEPRKICSPDDRGVQTTDTFVKKTARPPPGFGGVVSSKKAKVSAPPGFKPLEDRESHGHGSLKHDISSDKEIRRQHTIDHHHHVSSVACKPSIFGRTLTSVYIPPRCQLNHLKSRNAASRETDASVTGRHDRTLLRQFSYERQTSLGSTGEDAMETIVPFDFSTPSPDDIVHAKQRRAFVSGGHS